MTEAGAEALRGRDEPSPDLLRALGGTVSLARSCLCSPLSVCARAPLGLPHSSQRRCWPNACLSHPDLSAWSCLLAQHRTGGRAWASRPAVFDTLTPAATERARRRKRAQPGPRLSAGGFLAPEHRLGRARDTPKPDLEAPGELSPSPYTLQRPAAVDIVMSPPPAQARGSEAAVGALVSKGMDAAWLCAAGPFPGAEQVGAPLSAPLARASHVCAGVTGGMTLGRLSGYASMVCAA